MWHAQARRGTSRCASTVRRMRDPSSTTIPQQTAGLRVVRVMPVLDFGGVESRVTLQARLMDRSRFDLRVFTFHKSGAAARAIRDSDVPVDVGQVDPSPRNPRATLNLARYLRHVRPDVIHSSIAEANFHALLASRLVRVPVVIAEEVGTPAHGRVARAAFHFLYRGADAIVCVTQATCDEVMKQDRVPRERLRLVYNCAGPEYFPDPPRAIAPRGGDGDAPFRVLLVGRLVPVKNQLTFLSAFAPFAAAHPTAQLEIVGDGPLRADLERRIQELGIGKQVHLVGFQPDVRERLASADLFALPSLSEGCSISLVEAMATGVQIVASRVPGVLEVLGELAGEWTVEPTNVQGWTRLLHRSFELDPATRCAVARSAQEVAYRRFSPKVYIASLETLYTALCQRSTEVRTRDPRV